MTNNATTSWVTNLFAVTIFSEDLHAMGEFYDRVFELPRVHEDDTSIVYRFDQTMINIIDIAGAPELIEPAPVAGPSSGARSMFSVRVDDVDALYQQLVAKGVEFLNGPVDRPWGPRTATFSDPAGHMWEIAS